MPAAEPNSPLPVRRRDAVMTRARILAAARRVFAARDYTQARISDIAAAADVNQALVIRYFGSKEQLFEIALEAVLAELPMQDGYLWEGLAGRIVDHLTDDSEDTPDPLPMVIHATSDPVAQAISMRLMKQHVLGPLGAWLGGTDGDVRAAEILALCAGFFTYRRLLPLAPFAGAMDPGARQWLERALQDVLDGSMRGKVSRA
ncbi:TetR/AcrR family transcriptional regulator [Sphingomonas immobilis]|uniref:TetR family transcriptional regulator n=1 Tax=Sphingomonas immobilis TaxID=3063997 RepID=A0ABT8ZXD2_9SPHN|nr:TetR/AcrR family transcriptional regulator [Sphingomonas sp. CA1-15]MDO7842203.1 TetR family transcriptional regulator [Sphingomonas sp. CA1-15]